MQEWITEARRQRPFSSSHPCQPISRATKVKIVRKYLKRARRRQEISNRLKAVVAAADATVSLLLTSGATNDTADTRVLEARERVSRPARKR